MKNAKAKTAFVLENGQVVGVLYEWADGETTKVMLDEFSPSVAAQATAMGIREALRDTFAAKVSPAEGRAMMTARLESMRGPEGSYARRGGGAAAISTEMLIEAILAAAQETGAVLDAAKVRAKVADWDAKKRNQFVKAQPAVAKALAAIIADRNGGGNAPDLEDMFQ